MIDDSAHDIFSPTTLSFFDAIAAYKTINCTVFVVGDQAIGRCGISQRQFLPNDTEAGQACCVPRSI
jgi:hypothetical protein